MQVLLLAALLLVLCLNDECSIYGLKHGSRSAIGSIGSGVRVQPKNDHRPYFSLDNSDTSGMVGNISRMTCKYNCNSGKREQTGSVFMHLDGPTLKEIYTSVYNRNIMKMENEISPHMLLREGKLGKELGCEILTFRTDFSKGDVVLDVGAGFGSTAICIARQFYHLDVKVTAITVSEPELELAALAVKDNNLSDRITLRLMDMNNLPADLQLGSYKLVVNRESFAYAHDSQAYLKAVHSLLRPNGKLHIIGGMLRRRKMTHSEGKRLADLYINTMGADAPCCLRTVDQVSEMIAETGFSSLSTHDLAPYVSQTMEEVLVDNHYRRQNTEYMVHVARAMLSGSASFFFLEAMRDNRDEASLRKKILSVQNKIRRTKSLAHQLRHTDD